MRLVRKIQRFEAQSEKQYARQKTRAKTLVFLLCLSRTQARVPNLCPRFTRRHTSPRFFILYRDGGVYENRMRQSAGSSQMFPQALDGQGQEKSPSQRRARLLIPRSGAPFHARGITLCRSCQNADNECRHTLLPCRLSMS